MRWWILLLAMVAGCAAKEAAPPFDLVIRNGQVLDGSGKDTIAADVGIIKGKFAKIGVIPAGAGANEIDAKGWWRAGLPMRTRTPMRMCTLSRCGEFYSRWVTTIVTGTAGSVECRYLSPGSKRSPRSMWRR
jgi:N-acyl-D-aspartate/D-glutamate deacylase